MKSFVKALTFALALAVVISALAVFAGAAGGGENVTVSSNFDFSDPASAMPVINNTEATVGSKTVTTAGVERVDADNPYGVLVLDLNEYASALKDAGSSANPLAPNQNAWMGLDAGNIVVSGSDRAAEYVVIDLDISTDSEFLSGFTFKTSLRDEGGKLATNRTEISVIGNNVRDGFGIVAQTTAANSASKIFYPAVEPEGDWINLTVVVDCSDAEKQGVSYFYLDGHFVGSFDGFYGTNGVLFQHIRFDVVTKAVQKNLVSSIAFDNASIRSYKTGYEGGIKGNLGLVNVTLDHIPELSYWDDGFRNEKITARHSAFTVDRAGELIDVNTVKELERMLLSGDKVTVNRNITDTILVIPEGVTFASVAGEDYDFNAVYVSDITTELGVAPDYVIRDRDGSILAKGANNQTHNGDSDNYVDDDDTDALSQSLAGFVGDNKYARVQLLDDIYYGRNLAVKGKVVFDLNGHKLTFNTQSASSVHTFSFWAGGRLSVQNGKVVIAQNGTSSISNLDKSDAYFIFENLECLTYNKGTLDHRAGMVMFKNILDMTVNMGNTWFYRMFSRNSEATLTSMVIDGCSINTKNSHFLFTNLSTGGKKYGGARMLVTVKNSTFNSDVSPFVVKFNADTTGQRSNLNSFDLRSEGCTFNCTSNPLVVSAETVCADMKNTVTFGFASTTFASEGYVDNRMDPAYGTPRISVAVGTLLADLDIDGKGCDVVFDGTVARTNAHPGYPLIVTNEYTLFVWDAIGETFEEAWALGEQPSIEDAPVELPEETDYYSYSWVANGNDGYRAIPTAKDVDLSYSLSLAEDMRFNIYLPATADLKSVTVAGKETELTTAEIDGVPMYKATSYAIRPDLAGETARVCVVAHAVGRDTVELSLEVNLLNYCISLLNSDDEAHADAKPLMTALIDYIDAVYRYAGKDSSGTGYTILGVKLSDVYKENAVKLDSYDVPAAVNTLADTGAVDSVRLNLTARPALWFTFEKDFVGTVIFTYGEGEGAVSETVTLDGNGGAYALKLSAEDISTTVTVTAQAEGAEAVSGQYNLTSYLEFCEGAGHNYAGAVARTLLVYSLTAGAYTD